MYLVLISLFVMWSYIAYRTTDLKEIISAVNIAG